MPCVSYPENSPTCKPSRGRKALGMVDYIYGHEQFGMSPERVGSLKLATASKGMVELIMTRTQGASIDEAVNVSMSLTHFAF